MEHRIKRKIYDIYAFDIESHNDEESIAKQETSMWLGCLINDASKMEDESNYFYDMDSFLDNLESISNKKRKKIKDKNEKRPRNNICIWIYNLSFEWSFMLPVLLKRGFIFSSKFDKDSEFVYNSITTKTCSSVWEVHLKFKKSGGEIILRDLAKIFGGGLAKVAKAFNLPTQKGEIDYRLNRLHGHIATKEEKEYIFKDCRIIIDILLKLMNDKDFWNVCSMASYSMKKLLKFAFPRKMKPYLEFRNLYPELGKEESEFLRHSVGGGITYATPTWQFKDINVKIGHIDKHQMHPTQMATKFFPYGEGTYFKGIPQYEGTQIACCHIKVSYDVALLHSVIKLINNNYMVTDAEIWVWDFEIPTMKKVYKNLEIEYIDGYIYNAKRLPFRNYIEHNYRQRKKARKEDNQFNILYYKLLNNSSYGKFLENGHNEIIENCINELGIIDSIVTTKEEEVINAKYTYIPVGSCIPAYSRVDLIETAIKFCTMGKDGYIDPYNICYFDTDSIFFIWNEFTEKVWKTIPQEDWLDNWGFEEFIDRAQFTAPKRYKTETNGITTIKSGGINFESFRKEKVNNYIKEHNLDISEDEKKEMIKNYLIDYEEVNIISSIWNVQRAYRVKGGTIIEFQLKEMKVGEKYLDIYKRNMTK